MDVFSFFAFLFGKIYQFMCLPINLGTLSITLWQVMLLGMIMTIFVEFIKGLFKGEN